MNNRTTSHHGFTLIELLVVIAIIGLLSSIVFASLSNARAKARDTRRIADINQLEKALALYFDTYGVYPNLVSDLVPRYIPTIPTDPSYPARDYRYVPLQTTLSVPAGVCDSYHLGALLEQTNTTQLQTDGDWLAVAAALRCTTEGDFTGLNRAVNQIPTGGGTLRCGTTVGTPQPGGTEVCYDVKP